MGQNNFTDIDGFNDGRRRYRPVLRAAVAAALAGAALCAVWAAAPYAVLLTVFLP
jgi:hypothetical protein